MELLPVVKACFALSALLGAGLLYVVFHEPVNSARARRHGRHDWRSRDHLAQVAPTVLQAPSSERSGRIGGK
jgi:hypothetical protein